VLSQKTLAAPVFAWQDKMMSHRLKITLFVLAFNVIGFAEGYLLRDLGLV
jgi:hypothetical protein